MSFFDSSVFTTTDQIIAVSWSSSEFQPILAVSLGTPKIVFLQQDGSQIPNFQIHKKKVARILKWHPVFPALAIGWDDGQIMLWNEDERLCREEKMIHRKTICNITFNSDGSRMITCDVAGTVGVWRTQRGLTPICSFNKSGAMKNVIFSGLSFDQDSMEKQKSSFFFGGESGKIYIADDLKYSCEICKVSGSIKSLLFYDKYNSFVIVSSNLLLVQFRIDKLVPDKRAKLSVPGDPDNLQIIWAGSGLLAAASGENMIRLFNIQRDQNYFLTLADQTFQGKLLTDKITSIAYNSKRRTISCGTQKGYLVQWRCKQLTSESPASSDCWEAKLPVKIPVKNTIHQVQWGINYSVAALVTDNSVSVLSQTTLKKKKFGRVKMMQISSKQVSIRIFNPTNVDHDSEALIQLEMNVKGMDCNETHAIFWNGKYAQIYDINKSKLFAKFECKATVIALGNEEESSGDESNVLMYMGIENKLDVVKMNDDREKVQTIAFNQRTQGNVNLLSVSKHTLAMATSENLLKIFNMNGQKLKAVVTRKFEKNGQLLGEIKNIVLNSNATHVAMLCDKSPLPSVKIPDTMFYVYDINMDNYMEKEAGFNRIPTDLFWDEEESRMLAVQTEYVPDISKDMIPNQDIRMEKQREKMPRPRNVNTPAMMAHHHQQANQSNVQPSSDPILPGMNNNTNSPKNNSTPYEGRTLEHFFVTSDHGIGNWDSVRFQDFADTVLGMKAPQVWYIKEGISEESKGNDAEGKGSLIVLTKVLRDFENFQRDTLEQTSIKRAILDFSFHLTCDNLDQAYNSVRSVNNVSVWKALALMCVKNRRLDVAQICMGNMRFARGAKAVRQVKQQEKHELEPQLAMVALQLGMRDLAKDLYENCGRSDLLTKTLIYSGEFSNALEVVSTKNRINLKHTHYKIAQNQEALGEFQRAIQHYQLSGNGPKQIPRMLFKNGIIDRLKHYVDSSGHPQALKWWAQFQETQGLIEGALNYYKRAKDYGSMVRIFIQEGDLQKAQQIVLESGAPSACFHLAQALQQNNDFRQAIQFYARANKLSQGIRLAKEHGFDQEVLKLSLRSSKPVQAQSAIYFEKKMRWEPAAKLFHCSGNTRKAMEICDKYKLFEMMKDISKDIASHTVKGVITGNLGKSEAEIEGGNVGKTAQFFIDHEQYDKAVEIFVSAHDIEKAMMLCEQQKVHITEEVAQQVKVQHFDIRKMLPPKAKDATQNAKRKQILIRLGKIFKQSGLFLLACKCYAAGGDILKGMKALVLSGNEQTVIKFANKVKNKQCYILAGNFLQNTDWHNDGKRMGIIIEFYNQAGAFEQLASFYDACAQVQIDEYRQYGKALDALKEAKSMLQQAEHVSNKAEKLMKIQRRMEIIGQLLEAKKAEHQGNGDKLVHICNMLLDSPDVRDAVRVGDVFAMLVEYYYQKGDKQQAYGLLQRMRAKKIAMNPYIDSFVIQDIENSVGMKQDSMHNQADEVDELPQEIDQQSFL